MFFRRGATNRRMQPRKPQYDVALRQSTVSFVVAKRLTRASRRVHVEVHMPWHCPACRAVIRHAEIDERPSSGHTYRCHVCRLDLRFDARRQKLEVAPLDDDERPREMLWEQAKRRDS